MSPNMHVFFLFIYIYIYIYMYMYTRDTLQVHIKTLKGLYEAKSLIYMMISK